MHLVEVYFQCWESVVQSVLKQQQCHQEVASVSQEGSSRMGVHVHSCLAPGVQTWRYWVGLPEKTKNVISLSITDTDFMCSMCKCNIGR